MILPFCDESLAFPFRGPCQPTLSRSMRCTTAAGWRRKAMSLFTICGETVLWWLSLPCGRSVEEKKTPSCDRRFFSGLSRLCGARRGRTGTGPMATRRSASSRAASTTCPPSIRKPILAKISKVASPRGKRRSLVKIWQTSPARLGQVAISTGSSTQISLPDASIDYVFVDPPFGSNIYYADLAYLVESWHRVWTDATEEAIVNQSRRIPRTLSQYGELMERCFAEFHRVLKPGRWMTVEFSNSSNEVWLTIQHALARAGFVVADTRIIDKEQLSYRQVTATNAVKRDLVISVYKPADELAERIGPAVGTPDTAWAFVREHLRHLPHAVERDPNGDVRVIRERLPDRLYDRMEAFHLQRNLAIPVTAAEFYEGLAQRFPQRDGMHFLDEQVEAYERQRMTIKELKAAQLFITDEESAIQWLRQFLKSRRTPQPYAAIQPEFFPRGTSRLAGLGGATRSQGSVRAIFRAGR